MKVFLVEDSELLRGRLEAMIRSIPGAEVVGQAEGADEAVQKILALHPDTVVLDIHLKQGNGFDVMRSVNGTLPGVGFYVLTNYPAAAYRASAERNGARGFFDKSSEFERLRDTLLGIVPPR
jgi:two-component system response regulator DevR